MTYQNSTNIGQTGILTSKGDGTFSGSPVTQHYALIGGANNTLVSLSPSVSGYVLTSNGALADPSFQPSSALSWVQNTATSHTFVNGDAIVALPPSPAVYTLNSSPNLGDTYNLIIGVNPSLTIAQNSNQFMSINGVGTTTGASGSFSISYTTNNYTRMTIVCTSTVAISGTDYFVATFNGYGTVI